MIILISYKHEDTSKAGINTPRPSTCGFFLCDYSICFAVGLKMYITFKLNHWIILLHSPESCSRAVTSVGSGGAPGPHTGYCPAVEWSRAARYREAAKLRQQNIEWLFPISTKNLSKIEVSWNIEIFWYESSLF